MKKKKKGLRLREQLVKMTEWMSTLMTELSIRRFYVCLIYKVITRTNIYPQKTKEKQTNKPACLGTGLDLTVHISSDVMTISKSVLGVGNSVHSH